VRISDVTRRRTGHLRQEDRGASGSNLNDVCLAPAAGSACACSPRVFRATRGARKCARARRVSIACAAHSRRRLTRAANPPCAPSERASGRESCTTGLNSHPRKSSRSRTRACPRPRAARSHPSPAPAAVLQALLLPPPFCSSRSLAAVGRSAALVGRALFRDARNAERAEESRALALSEKKKLTREREREGGGRGSSGIARYYSCNIV